jgi:TolB-like protein
MLAVALDVLLCLSAAAADPGVPATDAPAVVERAEEAAAAVPTPPRACSLAVLDIEAGEGFSAQRASALSDVVTGEVGALSGCSVLSRSDIRGVLSLEAEKQLLGCSTEANSCLAELSDALGVDYLVTGQMSKINESMLLSLRMTDMKELKVKRRATDTFAGQDDEAIAFVAWLARKLVTDDAAAIGDKPVGTRKRNTLVERRATVWRTLAWTGVAATGVAALVTVGLGATTLGLSEYTRTQKQTAPTADVQGIQNLEETGPLVADGANLALYITGGLAVGTIALFFLPGEELAELDVQDRDAE